MAEEQPAPAAKPVKPSILDRIKSADDMASLDKAKILLYGPSGAGKTSFGAGMPRPLIGLTEKQAVPSIKRINPKASVFVIESFQDLIDFVALAASPNIGKRFDSVVLDSLTDAQRMIKEHFTSRQEKRQDVTDLDTWGVILDKTASLMRTIRDAHAHVVVITLDAEEKVEGMGMVHRPAVLGKKLPNELAQFVQAVGYVHSAEMQSGAVRRQISFYAGERYTTKIAAGLDNREPVEPLHVIARMLGQPPPDDAALAERVAIWTKLGTSAE
jgi:hypothetical protein